MRILPLTSRDARVVTDLYVAAAIDRTLGRDPDEYAEPDVFTTLLKAERNGFALGAFEADRLCGEIHASRLQPRRFNHVFSELSCAVHPDFQQRGIGRLLFEELLARVDTLEPRVTRVELMLQAGNPGARRLYGSLGFSEEGILRDRVRTSTGLMVDDVYMARIRP